MNNPVPIEEPLLNSDGTPTAHARRTRQHKYHQDWRKENPGLHMLYLKTAIEHLATHHSAITWSRTMRHVQQMSLAEKWAEFLIDSTLRAYILAFCDTLPARPSDIVDGLIADDVDTCLDGYVGRAMQDQCIGHLMHEMVGKGLQKVRVSAVTYYVTDTLAVAVAL